MNSKVNISVLIFFLLFYNNGLKAAEWQWSVKVDGMISSETQDHPTAFLWIPPHCKQVRGVVVGQHNMLEEGILEHELFRKTMADLGFAEIWITPSIDMVFDFNTVSVDRFEKIMNDLAKVSGYRELRFAPVVPIGHSAAASYPWNFAAWNPQRTLAIVSIHGDAPLTTHTGSGKPNPDWGQRNINGIPSLMVMGEYEWGEERILPALQFKKNNPLATIGFLADAGHGHFDYSDELIGFLCLFLQKVAKNRLPGDMPLDTSVVLRLIDPTKGWLVDRWRLDFLLQAKVAPYTAYRGNKDEAFWVFDREMAMATEKYYDNARGKARQYIGYVQQGSVLPAAGFTGDKVKFLPHADGITFNVSAAFKDSAQGKTVSGKHAQGRINITRICGPVQKLDDTTFRISFYRMGFGNTKRSGDIWLMASHPGNNIYKSAVQQANFRIPIRNETGAEQKIDFPVIPDQKVNLKPVLLNAVSSAGEKVYYYVEEGPAEIDNNRLVFTKIPPRTQYPVKVTVVAWQWGRMTAPKLKSAEPVRQSFYIGQ